MQVNEQQLVEQAYRESVKTSISDIVSELQGLLTRRLTAYIAGVKDAKTVTRWANGEVEDIREGSERRLRTAYEIMRLLTHYESSEVARAWFVGLSPQLDDTSPAEAIHNDLLRDARAAARAFVVNG